MSTQHANKSKVQLLKRLASFCLPPLLHAVSHVGTKRTWRDVRLESVIRSESDMARTASHNVPFAKSALSRRLPMAAICAFETFERRLVST